MTNLTLIAIGACIAALAQPPTTPRHEATLIFPLRDDHNHAPGIVECPNGDLLVSWYRGSGERRADDVAVYGARRRQGETTWSEPFLMADTPGFPDCNTCMVIDNQKRLWLFWPTILANTWESAITNYRWSTQYELPGAPRWEGQGIILLRPEDFAATALENLDRAVEQWPALIKEIEPERFLEFRERLESKLYQRLGWQPRCKPLVLAEGRIVLPLYTDTFSISIMALSDDHGATWYASSPLLGWGNIQPTLLQRRDGSLVAYMRENGPRQRIQRAESRDGGRTWGAVESSQLPNPGSAVDGVVLDNGHWLLVYNDTLRGRHSLAVSISDDEGQTWKWTRHLERTDQGSYHYPVVIQDAAGDIHVVYSYFVEHGKSMKHAVFNESWVIAGD